MSLFFQIFAEKEMISFDDSDEVKSQYINLLDVEVSRCHSLTSNQMRLE